MQSTLKSLAIAAAIALLSLPAAAQMNAIHGDVAKGAAQPSDPEPNISESNPDLPVGTTGKVRTTRGITKMQLDSAAHPDALKNAEPAHLAGDGSSAKEVMSVPEAKTFAPGELDKSPAKHDFTTEGADPKAQLAPGLAGKPGIKAGHGLGANAIDGKEVAKVNDCPPGFFYKVGAGCGPKPGFCPDGYGAQIKGNGVVCQWLQANDATHPDVCPKAYHRAGETCVAN